MVISSKTGRAYAAFKCSDPRPKPEVLARFKEALENIKLAHEETKIAPETTFRVFDIREGKVQVLVNGEEMCLVDLIEVVEKKGANFMIFSSLPNEPNTTSKSFPELNLYPLPLPYAPNDIAARDLGDVINMLYGGTELFDAEGGLVVRDVFFREESGSYTSIIDLAIAGGNPTRK